MLFIYDILIASIYNATITNLFDTNHVFLRDFLVTMVYNIRLYESINYHLQYHKYKENFYHHLNAMFCFWFGWHFISIVVVLYYIYCIIQKYYKYICIIIIKMDNGRLNHALNRMQHQAQMDDCRIALGQSGHYYRERQTHIMQRVQYT